MPPAVSKQELIAEVQRLADELGEVPTLGEFEDGEYSSTPVYKQFESYNELKHAAGFPGGEYKITNEELISDLKRVADIVGHAPRVEEYQKHGTHSKNTLANRWGNWASVLEASGFEPTDHSKHWADVEYQWKTKWVQNQETDCNYCGKTFEISQGRLDRSERNFCSIECKGNFQSQQTGEDAVAWEGGSATIECERCGDTRDVVPARAEKSRFCSQSCMLEWHREVYNGDNHPRWEGGYEPYYGPDWLQQREKALERDTYQCQVCGMDEDEHQEKWGEELHVHHRTRFGDFEDSETANQLNNLVTVCKTHHALIEAGRIDCP